MGVGLRPTGKPLDEPPNPKAARAAFLSQPVHEPVVLADPFSGLDKLHVLGEPGGFQAIVSCGD